MTRPRGEVDAVITGRIVPPWMFIEGLLSRVRYLLTLLTGNREAEQWAYDVPNWIYVNSVPDQHALYHLAVCYTLGACYCRSSMALYIGPNEVLTTPSGRSVTGKRRNLRAFCGPAVGPSEFSTLASVVI